MSRPAPSGPAAGRARLPVQARDRRPALAALALLLVLVGALGAALVVYRSGSRTEVLVAAHDIAPGQQVTASDFTTARISTDSDALVASTSTENSYLGAYARVAVPQGTLVNFQMFQRTGVLPSDGMVVGITVAQQLRPATPIADGDVVRAFYIPKSDSGSSKAPTGATIVSAARVVAVQAGSVGGSVTVSLLVTSGVASALVSASAQDAVALAALPVGTKPSIDFVSGS